MASPDVQSGSSRVALAKLAEAVFAGGGEMGALMRAMDWSKTPIGPVNEWPQSLKTAVRIILTSRYAMFVWWGRELINLYNDPYRAFLGAKHPAALGKSARDVWAEIWEQIGPRTDAVLLRGESTFDEALLLLMERHGYPEETYFTFAYSPLPDDSGNIGGLFCAVTEETEQVIGERRLRLLREVAAAIAEARTPQQVCESTADRLAGARRDLPFSVLYLLQPDGRTLRRAGVAGIDGGHAAAPISVSLDAPENSLWPFRQVMDSGEVVLLEDVRERFSGLPTGDWSQPPHCAVLMPIAQQGQARPAGVFVAGLNPHRKYSEEFRGFVSLLADQIAAGIANAVAHEAERRRAETLAELDRAKTLFFNNVSHEFRTPLTLILGPLEDALAQARQAFGPQQQEQLAVARRNALRLLKLVNTLLDFSRIEAGRMQAVYEPTDLGALTSEIASVFRSAVEKAGLGFRVECEPLPQPVYVDRDMWEKVVLNLLSNAFKFTFEGEIAITLKAVDGAAQLQVRDSGVGIPQAEQERIFERFHRIESARSRTYEGTGIGLSLVQELLKLHGGTVRVASEVGRGSTFTVTLPLGSAHLPADRIQAARTLASTALSSEVFIEEAERWLPQEAATALQSPRLAAIPATLAQAPPRPGEQECIVIADDNADMREYLAHLLRSEYQVHAVRDGVEAVDAVRRLHPALVLADVMMPRLDGFGVLRALRSDSSLSGTPVILLSARAGEESRVEGLYAGADDYLIKPFTARELQARVATHITMAGLRREASRHEARLREQAELDRHRMEELLAQAPAAIGLMTGPEHRWTYVNDQYVRVTGRTSAVDFLGKTLRESLPEIEPVVFELLERVYRTGEPYFGRELNITLNRRPGGQPDTAYFDFVYQPVRGVDGQIEGILVHAVEVTDKVLARKVIEDNAERFRLAEAAAQIGTWEWDPVMNTRTLSSELHRIFGTDPADPQHADRWGERVLDDDRELVQQRMSEGHRAGGMEFEYRYQHPELGLRWLYCKGRRLPNETRMFGVVQDITERKRTEQALRESEQRLRMMTDASPVLVWMAGTDKLCYYFNKSWLDFVGRTLEQERGNGWAENVHPDDFDRCLQTYIAAFDARRPFEMEYRLRHHSGEYRWILDRGVPRFAPDGTFEGYVGGCLDVHDQKEAADKLRAAAEELRESEERYRTVAETASDAILSIDSDSTILFANSATSAVFGYAPEELVGKNLTILMPDYMRHLHDAGLRRYIATGERHLNWDATELPGLHKDGREIPLEVSFGEYTRGGQHYFTGFARDITERKRVEQALRHSEEEFRALANAIPQLVWMARPDGWIFWYNQRWYGYTGTTPEEMEGWGWTAVHDPTMLPTVLERWKSSIATEQPFEMTFPIRSADGTFRPFLTRTVPVRDARGKVLRWFGTNTDVSLEVRIQDELRRNQERLRTALIASQRLAAIVESTDDAIVSKDLHGIVTSWNPAAEKIFGYTAAEMVGRSILTIIPRELHADEDRILSTIAAGGRIDHFETVRLTKSGERIDVSLTISPLRDENGRIVGAAKIARDITQRKRAEAALRTSERLASVGRLAATVAHEINNPLEAVTNLVYLAKHSAGSEEVRDFLATAEEELERISHLTKQTLGFYRETRGASAMRVGGLVTSLLTVFAPRTRNRNIEICPEIRQDPVIHAVPGEVRQLLSNLVGNSLDAVDGGGKIRIRVSAATGRNGRPVPGVRLTVADTGQGIPPAVRSRLFEPFFTTKKDVGTGLGLWVCKSIVDKHHGSIRVRSATEPGKSWTVVSVFLPAQAPSALLEEELRQAV